jgi:hypothetical protein
MVAFNILTLGLACVYETSFDVTLCIFAGTSEQLAVTPAPGVLFFEFTANIFRFIPSLLTGVSSGWCEVEHTGIVS